jgi:hypothetical protein
VKSILGYGRYDDEPDHVGCPRAKSDMTPCVARDGSLTTFLKHNLTAKETTEACIGCGESPAELLKALVRAATEPA